MWFAICFSVIEVSCGEYGDNIKTLINAINNGKYDIREGYPFPETKEGMNNCGAATGILKNSDNLDKDEKFGWKVKNKNDSSNLEEKFPEEKTGEISNGKLISGYATNDIAKQGNFYISVMNTWRLSSCSRITSINIIFIIKFSGEMPSQLVDLDFLLVSFYAIFKDNVK